LIQFWNSDRLYTPWYDSNQYKWIKTRDWNRITNTNREYYVLIPVLKSQSELRIEKIETNKTLIRLVATYGAASWALNKDIAKGLLLLKEKS
jgi:hypothetical protein